MKPKLDGIISGVKQHSPLILSCTAAAGVVGTGVTSALATIKARKKIEENQVVDRKDMVKLTWYYYIPVFVMSTGTIICIFGAHLLNHRQSAALASAYQLLSESYTEYKEKLQELYGIEAHNHIMDEIAKNHCDPPYIWTPGLLSSSSLDIADTRDPEVVRTFYDQYSQRYFESTLSDVLQAEYHLNRNFTMGMDVSLNDFYEFLGIDKVDGGDEVGWSMDSGIRWIDFDHRITVLDDGMEVVCINFEYIPTLPANY